MNLFSGSNRKYSSIPENPQPTFGSYSFSLALLFSSITTLFALPVGSTFSPPLSQLYQASRCIPASIAPISINPPMPQSTALQVPNIPLHIPSFSLSMSSILEKVLVLPSSLPADTIHASSLKASIPIISLTFE